MNAQVHRSSKWRKREKQISWHNTFGHNDESHEVMKSNLPTEEKWMHKFTSSKWRERKTNFMSLIKPFVRMIKVMKKWKLTYRLSISEVPMHKFTEVASGEREKQISCHSPHLLSEW